MIAENLASVIVDIVASLGMAAVIGLLLAVIALCVLLIVGRVKLFKKAGLPGWKAIVPLYTNYVFAKDICNLHTVWAIASVVLSVLSYDGVIYEILGRFISLISFYNLAKKTNSDKVVTTVFGTLTPAITTMVLGLNKCTYDSSVETRPHGIF